MGSVFLPGHAAWCTLLLWASAQIGGFIAYQLRLPRVIGMLCAGLLMRNIPWSAVDAFPPRWGTQMRAAALGTIFLRCGLELDLNVRVLVDACWGVGVGTKASGGRTAPCPARASYRRPCRVR